MRKILALLAMFMLCGLFSHAQQKTITGKVIDSDGTPLEGITVQVRGTNTATSTNAAGEFTIKSSGGNEVLVFTGVGFKEQTLRLGNQLEVTVIMQSETQTLEQVVVTALGIERSRNSLPYAAQQIDGAQVSETRTGNAASSLSGKISGLQIQQGNGIGGSTNVLIRGIKSLTGNNQALFVVDGVPLNNSITNSSNQMTGRGGFDYGNAAADINPDEIASISVLKGAAASALYGSRAANGVIVITTKKGKKGMGVTVNSSVTFNSMDKSTFAKYQNEYGAGYSNPNPDKSDPNYGTYGAPGEWATNTGNWGFWYFDVDGDGTKDLVVPTTEDASYGQRFDPNLMVFQWDAFDKTSPYYHKARPWLAAAHTPASFYENSVSTNNNVNFTGGNDLGSFFLGYTRNDDNGILPNSRVLKNIVDFNATYMLTDKLTATGSVSFSKIDGKGRYGTGYDGWNVNQNFRQWYERNMDVLEQKDAYYRSGRQNITWNWADPSSPEGLVPIYTDNPYFVRYSSFENDTRSRFFGYASLSYKFTDWLNVMGRMSLDSYDELQEERIASGSVDPSQYSRYNRSFRESNYDLLANFNKDLSSDLNLKALLGMNLRRTIVSSIFASTNGGLVVPGLYTLSNSKDPVSAPTENYQPQEVDGYFAGATLGYKDYLFLDGTFRRDISSTLPEGNNAYNYFSVSGGWVFSKHLFANASWLSYGKLRANYAEVGNSAPWGAIADIYSKPDPFGTAILFSLPATKANSDLKPERTTSKELGIELAFFKNRLGLDATYYITNTVDQLIPVSISQATGFASKYLNAGNLENKGFELSVYGTPVKTQNFSWDIRVNFSTNQNKVVSLYPGSKNLPLGSFQGGVTLNAPLGQPYGQLWGKTYVYDSASGQPIVKSNGRYQITTSSTNKIGNVFPDWIGGVYNTLTYKGLSLGFLIDVRSGGDVFSLDTYYGMATGIYPETAQLNDLGNPSRDPVADGGGIIVPGVTADGKPNTIRVRNIYGTYGYSYNPNKAFVYDASYVKLREAVLSYTLPVSLITKTNFLTGATIGVFGRNLWIIHKNLPYSDPEENLSAGNIQGYQSGAYPTTRSIGVNLKLQF